MSDKRDNLDKIGTYSTISLPFELNLKAEKYTLTHFPAFKG